jgi:hypothetical protein
VLVTKLRVKLRFPKTVVFPVDVDDAHCNEDDEVKAPVKVVVPATVRLFPTLKLALEIFDIISI